MTPLDSVQGAAAAPSISSSASAPDAKAETTSDYETFLNMLTVQIQNQDPLSPMKSEDFAVQLATFSSVEQQVLTNDLIAEMSSSLTALGLSGSTDWIGREARIEGRVAVDGAAQSYETEIPAGTTRSALVVSRDGQEITRIDLGRSEGAFTWSGTDASGQRLLEGSYGASVAHYSGDDLIGTTPVVSYARIAEVRQGASGVILLTETGQELSPDDISGVRAPTQGL